MSNAFDDSPHVGDFCVSTNKAFLDVPWLLKELRRTYWGGWVTLAWLTKAIENSLCFGLYLREHGLLKQVGFARIVTDYATFAWLCDVYVADQYRRQGRGRFLIRTVMAHPDLDRIAILLVTNDAQKFYQGFGFTTLNEMKCMKRPGSR